MIAESRVPWKAVEQCKPRLRPYSGESTTVQRANSQGRGLTNRERQSQPAPWDYAEDWLLLLAHSCSYGDAASVTAIPLIQFCKTRCAASASTIR